MILTLWTLGVYWPVLGFGFVDYDDPHYVSSNAVVHEGLSLAGIKWAWQATYHGNWHPLVWMSYMLDSQLHEMRPAGFHATNLLLHLGSTLLLFVSLRKMTGQSGRSLAVAAMFAVHPLNVEAVAWISERKGALSTFCWMLALATYARYAASGRRRWYWLTALAMTCGLLAKAMLVSLPLALCLLDFWPLRRWRQSDHRIAGQADARGKALLVVPARAAWRLVSEKAPLFLLAAIFAAIAFQTQASSGALAGRADTPAIERLARVGVAYWIYLRKAAFPLDLAANYAPPTESVGWLIAGLAWMGLVVVSVSEAVNVERLILRWAGSGIS